MKKIIVLVTMIALFAGSVFAQSLPGDGFASPQNTATNGRIRSAADDIMRPDSFHNVRFDNWLGFASFQSTSRAGLGWATKIGGSSSTVENENGDQTTVQTKKPVYLGLFYGGSAWANVQGITTTERDGKIYFDPSTTLSANLPYNQVAVLIGAADMGFRLSFISTYNTINQKDFFHTVTDNSDPDNPVTTTDEYKSFEIGRGLLSPQLAWSMSNNIIKDVGIRPWATIDLGFNNNFSKLQKDGDDNVTINSSLNYFRPELQLGLGGVIIANKNRWRTSADFEYRIRMDFYDNEYNDANGKVAKISGRNGTVGTNTYFDEYFWMDHRIRPSISTQWNGDKLRLRAKLDLNFLLTSADTTPQVDDNGTLKIQGNVTNVFTFGLNPDLQLAGQWQVTEKFFINMGGRINLSALEIITTDSESYNDGSAVDKSKSTKTESRFGGASNQLTLGVTLNATDNLFFEAVCGGGTNARLTNNTFDVFSTGDGPLSFASILVGLKF